MMAGSGSEVAEASRLKLVSGYAFIFLNIIVECLVCVTRCSGYVGRCGRHKSGS